MSMVSLVRFLGLVPVSTGAMVVSLALGSCALVPDPRPSSRVVVASWNVDNLFDEVHDGGEYPEFDPDRGWSRSQFWGRCASLANVIRNLIDAGPDILVLEEVEGAHALEVLNTRFLPDFRYRYTFLAPAQTPGVKTVFLSRYPFVRTGLFYPPGDADRAELRPLVEAEFDLGGRKLVVVGNHWKSRIPTPKATESLRRDSAQVLRDRLTTLDRRADRPFVVAVGDFNTSLELSRPWADRALVSEGAVRPDDLALVVFLHRLTAEAAPVDGAVWDPWETVSDPLGSYWYQGDWDRLDHTFVTARSLGLPDWRFGSFRVAAFAPEPTGYGPRNPNGISDHFPLVLTLVRPGH